MKRNGLSIKNAKIALKKEIVSYTEEYKEETGMIPVTSRWVRTFKRKAGKRIIKMRLVMKG